MDNIRELTQNAPLNHNADKKYQGNAKKAEP